MLVSPGIHRIETPLGERMLCIYVLIGDEKIMLVDSGIDSTPRNFILPYLRNNAPDRAIDFVLTTHADFDHMGGNASLREMFPSATFMAHPLDRRWIENIDLLIEENYGQFDREHGTKPDPKVNHWIQGQARGTGVDRELNGGETISLGRDWHVEINHCPGHTRGHLTVYDRQHRVAVIADSALGDALYTREGVAVFPPTYRIVHDYIQSAKLLAELAPEMLLTAHYPVMKSRGVLEFLQRTESFVTCMDDRLRSCLKDVARPVSALNLAELLSPSLGAWPRTALQFLLYPLLGHLEELEASGYLYKFVRNNIAYYGISHG